MPTIELLPELNFLSELYSLDAPDTRLLAEYPSSNSPDTALRNDSKYIIHDPFPPPRKELLKILGPHHLMCGWGNQLGVTSQVAPPPQLIEHWVRSTGMENARPNWAPLNESDRYITIFPHESISREQQVLDPDVNYFLHSKEVIEKIACPQAAVLRNVTPPCMAKLSHGYAGLGNFLILNEDDELEMRKELSRHWPDATLVVNSLINNIVGDFGIQYYLRSDGGVVWLGFTEQQFNQNRKWCGGIYSGSQQVELRDEFQEIVEASAEYLHSRGYLGLVGIDILRDKENRCFLVDVNPRLTGVTPFLMMSRIWERDLGLNEGIYHASVDYPGSLDELIDAAEQMADSKVVVVSGFEDRLDDGAAQTVCHLSLSSTSQRSNQLALNRLLSRT